MLQPMIRPTVIVFLILLPVVIFWAILPYFDPTRIVAEAPRTAPKWIDKANYGTCTDAMSGTPVTNQPVNIDGNRAARIGAGVIERQTDMRTILGNYPVVFKPVLLRREFPDGQLHLAWVYGQGSVTDNIGMSARVAFVYIDAATGDPLLLIDMFVGDPSFTCSYLIHSADWLERAVLQIRAGVVTVLYLLIMGIVALILRRRRRTTRQANLA
jgi:hypothetical protein